MSTEIYKSNVKRYGDLIEEKKALVPKLVDHGLAKDTLKVQGKAKITLKTQAGRKRGQASIRQMMSTFREDMLTLIPCWLCTPESVSAIFPMEQNLFDLMIFDEASQCTVENSIPSIFRASNVVIAGDEQQLQPSDFFSSRSEDDEEDEGDLSIYRDKTNKQAKSLLEWAKPKFVDQWLTYHYRSDHGELINFSNYAFYDNRMQIAPSVHLGKVTKPIEFIQVDGRWENQTNRVEAEKVVEIVMDILRNDPTKPSLGIVTFNAKQQELITDLFDKRASEDPELQFLIEEARTRRDGEEDISLFIKNIENVQGDERDMILFSVAYAKDLDGRMVSNLGSLSQEAGENRLNVAISRARSKIIIVCSFEPASWTRVETYARGARLLKRYLEYAKAVSDGETQLADTILEGLLDATLAKEQQEDRFDSGFENDVCTALRKMGYEVHPQIGVSGYRVDLGIIHPVLKDRYILGVECDGAMYHSSKVARERDVYRQRFLEGKGWKIHRIWSRNWWKNKELELRKIRDTVDELLEKTTSIRN